MFWDIVAIQLKIKLVFIYGQRINLLHENGLPLLQQHHRILFHYHHPHSAYTPSQWGNYTTIACSITPLLPWIYFPSENSIWRSAAVTHNLIGRKIISNVKHSDARNSLPILDVIRSSDKRHSASKYCKWTLRQMTGVCYTRIYVLGAPSHFPTEYRHEAAVVSREHRMKWVVVLGDGYQWPLPWECTLCSEHTLSFPPPPSLNEGHE